MISRSIAILIASTLPGTALIFPMTHPLAINALVVGSLVTLLAALSLGSNAARLGAVALTLWVGLSAFLFHAHALDFAIVVPWTVATMVSLAGPFSAAPSIVMLPALKPSRAIERTFREQDLRQAA
jgi:hypothetical protein